MLGVFMFRGNHLSGSVSRPREPPPKSQRASRPSVGGRGYVRPSQKRHACSVMENQSIVSNSCRLLTFPSKCLCDNLLSSSSPPTDKFFQNLIILASSSPSVHVFADLGVADFLCSPTIPEFPELLGLAENQGWTHISSGTPGLPDAEPQPQAVLGR